MLSRSSAKRYALALMDTLLIVIRAVYNWNQSRYKGYKELEYWLDVYLIYWPFYSFFDLPFSWFGYLFNYHCNIQCSTPTRTPFQADCNSSLMVVSCWDDYYKLALVKRYCTLLWGTNNCNQRNNFLVYITTTTELDIEYESCSNRFCRAPFWKKSCLQGTICLLLFAQIVGVFFVIDCEWSFSLKTPIT